MFELPGLNSTGNVKEDLNAVRRYLARFVPQLEQELQALGVDPFASALNERSQGLTALTGAGNQQSTAAAVAEHLLDKNNPHGVTLRQLGYEAPQAQVMYTEEGAVAVLGGLILETRTLEVPAVGEADESGITRQEIDLGDWPVPMDEIITAGTCLADYDGWAGGISDMDGEHCGTIAVYTTAAENEAGTIAVWALGRQSNG